MVLIKNRRMRKQYISLKSKLIIYLIFDCWIQYLGNIILIFVHTISCFPTCLSAYICFKVSSLLQDIFSSFFFLIFDLLICWLVVYFLCGSAASSFAFTTRFLTSLSFYYELLWFTNYFLWESIFLLLEFMSVTHYCGHLEERRKHFNSTSKCLKVQATRFYSWIA